MGLPVVIERNNLTMPQERYNTDWVQEREVGVVIRDFRRIAESAGFLLTDGRLDRFRENARQLNNRAVYEIPAMLERIMGSAG
jgi:1,2-diacylglycerol 3-beta-galactosyltransferase